MRYCSAFFSTKRTPQRVLYNILPTLFFIYQMKIQECTFFFITPDHQGGVHQQTKHDMHIGAKEYHVQNNETRWNARVYAPDTVKSSRLIYMRVSCSYGCRTRDAGWVNCNVHSRKRIAQLLAISIAYWQRPEIDTTKTNNFHGLGLCLRFRNVQRDRVEAHWSKLWRGRCLARYVTHCLSFLGSLRAGKSLASSAVLARRATIGFCHFKWRIETSSCLGRARTHLTLSARYSAVSSGSPSKCPPPSAS